MSLLPAQAFGDPVPGGRARDIVRGVSRMLAERGCACLTEMSLPNGRRADIVAIGPRGEIDIIEVKSCLADFASDQKWPEYAPFCDRFYFAVDGDFPLERLPEEVGFIVADAFGGAVVRPAQVQSQLAPARRKALTLAFARLAAWRLQGVLNIAPADGSGAEQPAGEAAPCDVAR